ncbi:ATP-binding protein [Nocardiopsis aegyptia]|uniref:Anti-sigma regulatory factor (Ser/Thr protein kinase) n=1 Tax=Nocardiopsis aegyptia TaxID=220378 RepID=A0A7Z0EMN5_9ACTN|nr:ATP-binding protein [Nocardiopsis aegyptia]NYJ34943.1 anti-sigma regulatory factor (Ser/Thr protein kinase) [Nocardiopsis aegyptia]
MPVVSQSPTSAYPGRRWAARLYPGTPATTARVRAEMRDDLAELEGIPGDLVDGAALCASEAFANAVVHSRSGRPDGTVMRILSTPVVTNRETTLRLSVIDDGPVDSRPMIPAQCTAEEWQEAERGRGLLLIDHLATEWGTQRWAGTDTCRVLGTVIWAEFTYPTLRETA